MDEAKKKQATEALHASLERLKRETQSIQAEGEAGGGAVRAVLNGEGSLVDVKIDGNLVQAFLSSDPQHAAEFLEELIKSAHLAAHEKAQNACKDSVDRILQRELGPLLSPE